MLQPASLITAFEAESISIVAPTEQRGRGTCLYQAGCIRAAENTMEAVTEHGVEKVAVGSRKQW